MKKVIFLSLALILVISGCSFANPKTGKEILSPEEAKAKTEEFINENLMQPGSKAIIKSIVDEEGLYKIVVDIGGGQEIDSYLTKDGVKFFPQAIDIKEAETSNQSAQNSAAGSQSQPTQNISKNDKPKIELFVMSYCPYGTQVEKGIIPVIEALGDKIDFELKFCDYAMHYQVELNEQLRQYCIQKDESNKLISYLKCFLEDGDSDRCLGETGIKNSGLQSCVAATDNQYKVTEKFNDQNSWDGSYPPFDVDKADNDKYSIDGSPALVINGAEVSSGRNPASLLNLICSGFNEQPEECKLNLSSATPSPGFGYGTSSDSSASCGG